MTSGVHSRGNAAWCIPISCLQAVLSILALPLFLGVDAHAQWKIKPAVQISFPNYPYPKTLTSLRGLDLRNSQVIFFGDNAAPDFRADLHDGRYEKHDKIGGESVSFSWLRTVGGDSTDPTYAVAYYTWVTWAASASDFGVVQLLHVEDGRLKVIQQILFNTRGNEKAGAFFNAKSGVLTVRGLNEWEHCCPTGLDIVGFHLNDGLLKRVSYQKAPLE